jgi:hypothetical protein
LLVNNGIKEALMTPAFTDRIVARYMREAQQRQAEQRQAEQRQAEQREAEQPRFPVRRDEVHAGSFLIARLGFSMGGNT